MAVGLAMPLANCVSLKPTGSVAAPATAAPASGNVHKTNVATRRHRQPRREAIRDDVDIGTLLWTIPARSSALGRKILRRVNETIPNLSGYE